MVSVEGLFPVIQHRASSIEHLARAPANARSKFPDMGPNERNSGKRTKRVTAVCRRLLRRGATYAPSIRFDAETAAGSLSPPLSSRVNLVRVIARFAADATQSSRAIQSAGAFRIRGVFVPRERCSFALSLRSIWRLDSIPSGFETIRRRGRRTPYPLPFPPWRFFFFFRPASP